MVRLRTRAPAKVNLVLRVGASRPDGFHDLETLLVPLDLADRVEVDVSSRRGEVSCRCPGRPELDGRDNLAARAALALRRRLGRGEAVAIRVTKEIPVTAGLGGGSSDAAAVLRCLARAWRVRDVSLLAEVALEVGSDVPFFLGRGPAWAEGRGERLRRARVRPRVLLLAYPRSEALAIRAGEAYRWLDAARPGRPPRRERPRADRPENDLMEPCLSRRPALRALAGWLEEVGAAAPIMSGSGPTFFGRFATRGAAVEAAKALSGREVGGAGVEAIVARTVTRMPGVSSWKSPRSASSR
ncbi:MAG TPA: 4-(cytidine 5'-diphospho)-2-C-methyl-D-erythritol kinase [Anaeromyxobacteraceae bacterium]|nr:4-(cytidine 5'-diphospho)-2-C-methyl-D-erythritol kinase [Anaeromyxobacteraceae bacterium]